MWIKLPNLHFHPCMCNARTFDMQWRYVIGIPRDLFWKTAVSSGAVKVKPFSFFSSTTVKIRWLLKSCVYCVLCEFLFSDGLPLIMVYHSATVRNMIYHYIFLIWWQTVWPLTHVNSSRYYAGKLLFLDGTVDYE